MMIVATCGEENRKRQWVNGNHTLTERPCDSCVSDAASATVLTSCAVALHMCMQALLNLPVCDMCKLWL